MQAKVGFLNTFFIDGLQVSKHITATQLKISYIHSKTLANIKENGKTAFWNNQETKVEFKKPFKVEWISSLHTLQAVNFLRTKIIEK